MYLKHVNLDVDLDLQEFVKTCALDTPEGACAHANNKHDMGTATRHRKWLKHEKLKLDKHLATSQHIKELDAEHHRGQMIKLHKMDQEMARQSWQYAEKLLQELSAWEPPTSSHEAFKDAMVQMLNSHNIPDSSFDDMVREEEAKSIAEIIQEKEDEIRRNIAYRERELAKVEPEAVAAQEWMDQLLKSLPEHSTV